MTTAQSLARIERIDPRNVWPNEAQDFTPWLASHIDQLGEALGLELESEEAPVGDFSLDILARDVGRDRPVIIENQLEETNHRHLGQLLTYAAGYDASVVIWVAKEFRDEHRAALDLLNRHTDEAIEFFGVVVEVWRIADSPPAPHFRVVCDPNERRLSRRINQNNDTTDMGERYRGFFQELVDTVTQDHRFSSQGKAKPQYFCSFSAVGRHVRYAAEFRRRDRTAMVAVWMDSGDKDTNKTLFDDLTQYRDEIEGKTGKLDWDRQDHNKLSRVSVERTGTINDDVETLDEIQAWMVDRLLAFKKAFQPRLDELLSSIPTLRE